MALFLILENVDEVKNRLAFHDGLNFMDDCKRIRLYVQFADAQLSIYSNIALHFHLILRRHMNSTRRKDKVIRMAESPRRFLEVYLRVASLLATIASSSLLLLCLFA